jgi:hypothetical protein
VVKALKAGSDDADGAGRQSGHHDKRPDGGGHAGGPAAGGQGAAPTSPAFVQRYEATRRAAGAAFGICDVEPPSK